ncbi:MAG TPA: CDP-archaeol synthase [Candidatus Saccharimonadales bacterium]|nr:CDP-archaeol synthase [Candidatus Saccharimonadales bacterium]
MGNEVLLALWFFLPAGLANMAPIPLARLLGKRWNAPLDGGRRFRGKELFGANKTWRGLAIGIIVATAALWLQQLTVHHAVWVANFAGPAHYTTLPTLLLGPLFGLGALGGDAVESFCKRQRGTPPGHAWFPFDQVDYVAGSIICTLPVVRLDLTTYVWALLLWPLIHLAAAYIGFRTGFKSRPI